MLTLPELPRAGPPLTRRQFVQLLAVALPVWRLPIPGAPAGPLFLAQGPRGIWGLTDQPGPATAAFSRGPRGVLGLERGGGNALALTRGSGGRIGVDQSGTPTPK
jgi:hypothetical protein